MFTVSQEMPEPETKGLHEDVLSDPGWVDSSFITKCLNILERLLSGYSEALALAPSAYLHIAHGLGRIGWTLELGFECLARLAPVLCLSLQSEELHKL